MYAVNVGHYDSVGLSKKDTFMLEKSLGIKTYTFSHDGKYTIRVGVISDEPKAEGMVTYLKKLGFDAYSIQA